METQQPLAPQPAETPPSSGVEDSQVVGVNARDADVAERDVSCCVTVLKRKRGRPAKGVPKTTPEPPVRQKKDEEDVCFICFDGGSLVLCDRRSCPKAYHPACIKRDEAFFRSKAKWNCGWHICSDCGKASHYMCYTCTYSLCKGCTKSAGFVCVRGNKGLCGICMKTIKLIENGAQGNEEGEVDFDDKSSWEYLFKVYWMYLKGKLSLTFDEILRAKNPWKGAVRVSCKVQTPHELYHHKVDNGSGSENSCIDIDSNNLENKKCKRGDNHRHIWDGGFNDVGCNAQDLSTTCEPTGNMCIIKNQFNPNESAINDSASAGVVRLGESGVPADISSLLYSTGIVPADISSLLHSTGIVPADISSLLHSAGMEQPISDILNDKSWLYQDPAGKVQGPFCMLQLCKWNAGRCFPPDLRIWRIDEKQDTSILLTDALSGKCSQNVSLPHNSEQESLGASVTPEDREYSQDGLSNATRSEICANNQIIEQSGEQKVDDTCTQSNGKDDSFRSNGLHSQSPCLTIQADVNTSEGQSGNFERREESSKCEISCHDGPDIYTPLPSTAFSEKLNENPSDKPREGHGSEGNLEESGNLGSNRLSEGHSNSGQSDQKQSDSEENSGQSSGQNWRGPDVVHPPCDASSWLAAIFGEPTVDESVSDLLAEVEAMESLGGLESPTSLMKCGEELTDGSITDCLSFANGLGSMLDVGKSDALSSTGDFHLPSQSTTPEEPFQQADVQPHQKINGEQSSRNSEVESTFSRISWNPTNQYSWDPNR